MREQFVTKNFRQDALTIIETANRIIAEYQAAGFTLTLRQLYYQFVARAVIPNKQSEYKRLGGIVNDARLAGLMDWSAIEDRTRNLKTISAWTSPQSIMNVVSEQYQQNPWLDQMWNPEVWIEKDALIGVIEPVCERMRVPYFACRGYTSQSEAYSAGKRFALQRRAGRSPIVFHLGDHDPSGLDMTRDNGERLQMFARAGVKVVRLALNMDQVNQYTPPPNPAKDTDTRFSGYRDEYGDESWELDALEPTVIDALIQSALDGIIDRPAWRESMRKEETSKEHLRQAADRWDDVVDFLDRE